MKLMGWKLQGQKMTLVCSSFRLFSTTSSTLLLPLSYLILARLASARYLLSNFSNFNSESSFFSSFFLYTNPNILGALVSFLALNALLHALTDPIRPANGPPGLLFYPRVREAGFFLGTLTVCMGLGIVALKEATTTFTEKALSGMTSEKDVLTKLAVLVGMREAMLCWRRTMVGPVEDAAVVGGAQEDVRWAERVAVEAGFGLLWWWKVGHEVDSLVAVVEARARVVTRVGLSDVMGWWLYYLTLIVGIFRVAKGVVWVGLFVFCRRSRDYDDEEEEMNEFDEESEDKV